MKFPVISAPRTEFKLKNLLMGINGVSAIEREETPFLMCFVLSTLWVGKWKLCATIKSRNVFYTMFIKRWIPWISKGWRLEKICEIFRSTGWALNICGGYQLNLLTRTQWGNLPWQQKKYLNVHACRSRSSSTLQVETFKNLHTAHGRIVKTII